MEHSEDSSKITKRKESYNNRDIITQRIIQYFEDPKESDALAKIRKLSSIAKRKSSKNIHKRLKKLDDDEDIDLQTNTEKNRIMFREPKNQNAVKTINEQEQSNFSRRKQKFQTQKYEPKGEKINLLDEMKDFKNKNEINKMDDNQDKFNIDYLYEDRNNNDTGKNNKKISFEEKNDNKNIKNYKLNENKNYNKINNSRNNKTSNLKKYKKLNTEKNIKRARFIDKNNLRSSDNSDINNRQISQKIINYRDLRSSYNPAITEEYKKKNNMTIENIHNKEKLIINEYLTKDKDQKKLKNYKTEYVWDKEINRLVEKRIYLDDPIFENEENKDNSKINNKKNNLDENNNQNIKVEIKIEPEENKEEIKVNLKFKKEDDDGKEEKEIKKTEIKKIEIRKRFGKSQVIHKNEEKKKEEIEINKSKDINKEENIKKEDNKVYEKNKEENINEDPQKDLNGSYRYQHRINNYNKVNNDKTNSKKEIIIEKKIIKIEEDKKEENIYKDKEKETNKGEERNKENEKPKKKVYKKRNLLKLDDFINNKEGEPEKVHERNLTEIDNEPKYKNNLILTENFEEKEKPKVIYTKKIIIEERKPTKETIQEKSIENEKIKEEKPMTNPYGRYKKKNIRINLVSENFDDNQRIKNNLYSNYIKTSKKAEDKKIYRQTRTKTDSELIDDLEKIENYNTKTYLTNDLLQIYDSINEEFSDFKKDIFYTNINSFEVKMGDFDKRKIPYVKREIKAEDLCKGRVTTDDIYKKYSKQARTFRKWKKYK